jgi:hypothetical protein
MPEATVTVSARLNAADQSTLYTQEAVQKAKDSTTELEAVRSVVSEQEAAVKAIAVALAEKGQAAGKGGAALPALPENPSSLTVAELQNELKKHDLDTDWDPAKGKSVLVDRLTVRAPCSQSNGYSNPTHSC